MLNHIENHPSQPPGFCAVCNRTVIPTNYVDLTGRLYHFHCLQCHACGRNLSPWSYRELYGRPYCSKDYAKAINDQYARKTAEETRATNWSDTDFIEMKLPLDKTCCYVCGQKSFATEILYVMDRVYHKRCFKCTVCSGTLGVENYHSIDGQPYCKAHFRAILSAKGIEKIRDRLHDKATEITELQDQSSVMCHRCHCPVRPRDCINVLDECYHYNCFKCEKCGQQEVHQDSLSETSVRRLENDQSKDSGQSKGKIHMDKSRHSKESGHMKESGHLIDCGRVKDNNRPIQIWYLTKTTKSLFLNPNENPMLLDFVCRNQLRT
ncbi:LIM domain-containing protein PLIM2a [Clonorchis sinensis]|uniref:LIM domain-containing protein PLIM2a n=1 Tax=Clonorchis sinensis TaxID=79923 RepID=A0A8T1MNF8_CLOSI|nr:LIM domain-containing protein PLIM2a [Clonorchis sinensis]